MFDIALSTLLPSPSHRQHLEEAKAQLLGKLKNLGQDNYEDRGTVYYQLLHAYLQSDVHMENAILLDYYEKMSRSFSEQENKYRQGLHGVKQEKNQKKLKVMELKAFYKLMERYFSSLEMLYTKKGFNDSRQKAYLKKMEYRKTSFLFNKKYATYLGYVLFDWTSKYGTSFISWGVTTVLFIFLFGLVLMLEDRAQTGGAMVHGEGLYNYFYFSVVAFTTVGFGDIVPVTGIQKVLVSFEILSGYLMLGMLVNLIQKKLK